MSEPSATAGIDLHAQQIRKFRLQDLFFHRTTQLFAFVVLATLVGILVSLTLEAWPSLKEFGPAFLWNLNFRVVANGTELAQWGIVDPGWNPLPVYTALAQMAK